MTRAPRRAFADLAHGQVHYRHAGTDGPPLILLHAGPGSARQLEGMIVDLSATFRVVAPDMPGNGDSAALPIEAPVMADYAAALIDFLDVIGLDRTAVYGSHTGAALAAELAIAAPARVERLVLEGVAMFDAAESAALLARYAYPFAPDLDGAYLVRAFQFMRDQYLFFPWYDRTPAASLGGGLGDPRALHASLVEVLKAAETYQRAYHAAFRWPACDRLPLVACPALVISAPDDPLDKVTRGAAPLLTDGRFVALPGYGDPGFAAARRGAIVDFLAVQPS